MSALDALMENCFFYISRMYEFLHRLGQNRKGSQRIAVGTVIADRPPPRSVRAEFPHTAPTSGV